jgi:hypothetical protein
MNETRSTYRRGRTSGRLAVVLGLLLVFGLLPMAASAVPATITDAQAVYLNSATVALTPACSYQLDGGPTMGPATSVTTSLYGAHILALNTAWKDNLTGTTQTVMTIPFFVDDSVLPVITCDVDVSYVTTSPVTITLTATDNFNGSDIDAVFYRIDGGKLVQVVSDASNHATRLLIARLPVVKTAGVGPDLTTYDQTPPHGNFGTCPTCHDIVIPTPEPTSTPEPTGTPSPHGLRKVVSVSGVGTHTLEYWTQDIARNASAHVTKTFTITAPAPVVPVPTATTLSIRTNHTSLLRNQVVTISGWLKPGLPVGTPVALRMRKAGSLVWVTLSTRSTSTTGYWSYAYKVTSRTTYYFKARFAGTTAFAAQWSRYLAVSVR